MTRKSFLTMAALFAVSASAQDAPDADDIPDIRRYTVEMIIFSYAQSVSAGSEIFVPDTPPPVVDVPSLLADDLMSEPEDNDTLMGDDVAEDRRYELTMLDEQDFELIDVIQRLERLDAYEPMLHFGWTQAMLPGSEPETRPLSTFVTPPEGLEGELSLYLSRYLHLSVTLQLDAPEVVYSNHRARDTGYGESDHRDYPVRYRLQEDRIFRNGELRYFDHPKFGVLAKVSRVEENEELLDGELLGD